MNEKLFRKISPPFEGGVDGSADYLIFTKLDFPAGVVDFKGISQNTKR
ncbi:MAG: hypothetical protein IPJ16_13230 [Bacteroidales bacterium]|nr:hypothetical protein [Bacteroidales bacterium]